MHFWTVSCIVPTAFNCKANPNENSEPSGPCRTPEVQSQHQCFPLLPLCGMNRIRCALSPDYANFAPGIHFRPLYLPDHLSFGTEKIVVDILKRSGFEIVEIRKYPMLSSDLYTIAKEIIKLFWPHKRSSIRYLLNQQLYAEADMFILAQRL